MKRKIIILHFNMELGGAESSLLGLLDTIDYDRYDVDLFLYAHEGELMSMLNPNVRLLPEMKAYRALTESMKQNFAQGCIPIGMARAAAKIRSSLSGGPMQSGHNYKQYFHKLCIPYLPDIPGDYDLAISFNDPHYIVGKKVSAKVRMSWFHTDASQMVFCDTIEKEMWGMSDYVVNVSDACKQAFDAKHGYLTNKSIVVENMLSKNLVQSRSAAFSAEREMPSDGSIRLLSIGRFCAAKNFDNVPDICRRILASGCNVKWYLIGYGGDEALIRQRIQDAGMEERVIILGKKENPYPYIKACDLYVQPSRYEGKSVTVREAQILNKPVVITSYATSASQLEDGVDGVIVQDIGLARCLTEWGRQDPAMKLELHASTQMTLSSPDGLEFAAGFLDLKQAVLARDARRPAACPIPWSWTARPFRWEKGAICSARRICAPLTAFRTWSAWA